MLVIFVLYSLYAILKKNGWWFKKSVKGKHIFLTGGGSGLGRAVAIKMARLGAKLTLVDINEKTVEQTKRMIKAQTGSDDVQTFQLDVANREAIREVA